MSCDRVWMAEFAEESRNVWPHKTRTAFFLSAMRHFASSLEARGVPVRYFRLGRHAFTGFPDALQAEIVADPPGGLVVVEPGDFRVLMQLCSVAKEAGVRIDVRSDRHFLIDLESFDNWAQGRKRMRFELFYRYIRQRTGVLMDGKNPSFGKKGPGRDSAPRSFQPDEMTRSVFHKIDDHFSGHPGSLDRFDWPVTSEEAEEALKDFVEFRLRGFGPWLDALWTGEPYLYHYQLSVALNLKLISPRSVIDSAVAAYERGDVPLALMEGFVRQILGWREFVRGIYWRQKPGYLEENWLEAREPLPAFYWGGETNKRCLAETIGQILEYGYAHHIQRLMVTGLFALLLGVETRQIHAWYLAVFVDAVEWVELPNVIGMSQFADGGLLASKPYVASGRYIQRAKGDNTLTFDEFLGE